MLESTTTRDRGGEEPTPSRGRTALETTTTRGEEPTPSHGRAALESTSTTRGRSTTPKGKCGAVQQGEIPISSAGVLEPAQGTYKFKSVILCFSSILNYFIAYANVAVPDHGIFFFLRLRKKLPY
jgi:hypothetical protein